MVRALDRTVRDWFLRPAIAFSGFYPGKATLWSLSMSPDPQDPNPQDPNAQPSNRAETFINDAAEATAQAAQRLVQEATEILGEGVSPIADSPLFNVAARIPGLSWILAAVGKVNVVKIEAEVAQLRLEHPLETVEELSDRIIKSAAITAGGIGLLTNVMPPLALALFAVDLLAVAMLQAEMVFRIAAIYGFSLQDPARRGEVLTVFTTSLAASSAVKVGLSTVELLPIVGTAVGATGNAALIYTLGNGARQFYARKQRDNA